jgi:TolB-like protein
LNGGCGHEPIQARRAGILTRSRKWIRRYPTTAALIPLSIALLAAIGMLVWNRAPKGAPAGIAVLPFESLDAIKRTLHSSDGVHGEILSSLARVADLKVISRTSGDDYRGQRNTQTIGQALHVSYLLEGSVSKAGGRIRLDTELIDTSTDTNVWAQRL